MTPDKKIIKKSSLAKLFEKLKKSDKIIYAPVKNNDNEQLSTINEQRSTNTVEFALINDFSQFAEDYIQTIQSVKSVVFPRFEKILNYKKDVNGITLEDIDLSKTPDFVLFGVHPCDAAGFDVLNSLFTWDYNDKFFTERLKKITVIGLSCHNYDEFCFCTSVGLSPNATKGNDILLTKIKTGDYIADIITEKGKAVYDLAPELFENISGDIEIVIADVPVKFDYNQVTDKLSGAFENPLWIEHSMRCIGCGACAYVCPTCSCFDIQDEGKESCGSRVKCWDSCGFSHFTVHASGHNPREEQSQRWRQRVMHKYSYQPDRLKILGCVGCGRCSRACPVDMNLQEHLTSITN